MTNTVWQQSQKTRRVPHLAGGLQNYFDSDTPDATAAPPPDDLAREIADSNIPPLVAQPAPVNDLGGISAYNVVPLGPDDYVPAEPPPVPSSGQTPTPPPPSPAMPQGYSLPPSYADALAQQAKVTAAYPVLNEPKWWQRAIAGTLGGMAGYSNAASRTKNPINIQALQESINHPGYSERLEAYKNKLAGAQALTQIEAQKVGAQQAGAKAAADLARDKAQADYYEGLGRGSSVVVSPELSNATGGRYPVGSKIPAQLAASIENDINRRYVRPEKTMAVTDPALAQRLGVAVGTSVPYSLYQTAVTADSRSQMSEPALRVAAAKGDPDAIAAVKQLDDEMARRSRESRPPVADFTDPGSDGGVSPYIKAIGDYEQLPPSPRGSSPSALAAQAKLVGAVKKYNPAWDAKNYAVVQNGLKDFGSGKTSQSVDAINTVAGHLRVLDDAATALQNNDIQALNRIGNTIGLNLGTAGGTAVAKYSTIVHRIGPELGKVYGTATEGENSINQSDFDASRGSAAIHGAIGTSAQLLQGKINSLEHRWNTNVKQYNPSRDFTAVSPEAAETFKRLGGGGVAGGGRGGATVDPRTAYVPGHVYGGKTYLGGEPTNAASWR